jgi:uncharacterized membrane protein HdeD (DUF308 family)
METEIIKSAKDDTKRWFLLLLPGILFVCAGIWMSLTPLSSYLVLPILLCVTVLMCIIFEIIQW